MLCTVPLKSLHRSDPVRLDSGMSGVARFLLQQEKRDKSAHQHQGKHHADRGERDARASQPRRGGAVSVEGRPCVAEVAGVVDAVHAGVVAKLSIHRTGTDRLHQLRAEHGELDLGVEHGQLVLQGALRHHRTGIGPKATPRGSLISHLNVGDAFGGDAFQGGSDGLLEGHVEGGLLCIVGGLVQIVHGLWA